MPPDSLVARCVNSVAKMFDENRMNEQSFEATYAQMSDGELARVLRDKRDLVPEALKALDAEIQKRNVDPSQLRVLRPHSIDKPWRRTKLGHFSEKIGIEKLRGKRIRGVWLLALMVLSTLLIAILYHFGIEQLYWPIVTTISVTAFVIWGHSELKGRMWFWLTIAGLVTLHAAFFYFVGWPWGTKWVPAMTIAGFWNVDLVAAFALIWLIEKLMQEHQSTSLKPPTRG
jgi:hypothetical protein